MDKIAPYAKAIVAAVVAGLGSLQQALDGEPAVITAQEWVGIAMTFLVALGVVFAIPNRDPEAAHQDESVQPPNAGERGAIDVGTAIVIGLLVILLLVLLGVFR